MLHLIVGFLDLFRFFVHHRQRELWVAIDNKVLDIFIATLVDEHSKHLRTVRWRVQEQTFGVLFKARSKIVVVVLEDLALVQQLNQRADFVFSEVDDFVRLEIQFLLKEVQNHIGPCMHFNFAAIIFLAFKRVLSNNDNLLSFNPVVLTIQKQRLAKVAGS